MCIHTQTLGLLVTCHVAEAPRDEYSYFAWLLRREAFLRFDYDPDTVFSEKTGACGVREGGHTRIPGVNLLDLRAHEENINSFYDIISAIRRILRENY